jgi:hypothetical protein
MNIDESYKMKLLAPLKGTVGVKISDYLSNLKNNGLSITDKKGVVDEKFIVHFQHLINKGIITNSSGRVTLDSFGLEVGSNGHIILCDCSDILFVELRAPNPLKPAIKWLLNHVVAVIVATLAGLLVIVIDGL